MNTLHYISKFNYHPDSRSVWLERRLDDAMLAAATSFFSRTAISQSYNIGPQNGSRSSTPTPSGSSASGTNPPLPTSVRAGLWRVQGATHKVTSKRVSVWTFDKRAEMEGLGPLSKERVLEILKSEVTTTLTSTI